MADVSEVIPVEDLVRHLNGLRVDPELDRLEPGGNRVWVTVVGESPESLDHSTAKRVAQTYAERRLGMSGAGVFEKHMPVVSYAAAKAAAANSQTTQPQYREISMEEYVAMLRDYRPEENDSAAAGPKLWCRQFLVGIG